MRSKNLTPLIIVFALACGVFAHSVEQRAQWFGPIDTGIHEWLTGSTVKFAKNWYREGPANLDFLMLEEPSSVEFPTLDSRKAYLSYPPGTVLPIYLIAKLVNRPPSATMVMRYNLLNHFLITLLLATTCYFLLCKLGVTRWFATALSAIPIGLQLNMGAPMYWHQNVYFSDQAVILFFVGIISLEVFREDIRKTKYGHFCAALFYLISFYGVLVDWFFVVVLFVIFLKRCFLLEFGRTAIDWVKGVLVFCLPPIAALGLFSMQFGSPMQMLNGLSGIAALRSRQVEISPEFNMGFNERIWEHLLPYGYGDNASYVLLAAVVVFVLIGVGLLRARSGQTSPAMQQTWIYLALTLIPCLLHLYTLQNHSWIHDFSVLKFGIFLSVGPFLLLPAMFLLLGNNWLRSALNLGENSLIAVNTIAILALLSGLTIFLLDSNSRAIHFFAFKQPREYLSMGSLLEAESSYQDIVFSPHIEIPNAPPIMLSYSMKRVYLSPEVEDLQNQLDRFTRELGVDNFNVAILVDEHLRKRLSKDWQEMLDRAELISSRLHFSIYRYQPY
ncbi:MAG: hypothetical protein HOM55_10960 [Proteobacteria bacterium]|nr:hypothetical protein [Pseudomonadota bacterium]